MSSSSDSSELFPTCVGSRDHDNVLLPQYLDVEHPVPLFGHLLLRHLGDAAGQEDGYEADEDLDSGNGQRYVDERVLLLFLERLAVRGVVHHA